MKPGSVIVDLAVERGGNVEGAQAGRGRRGRTASRSSAITNVPGRLAASASGLYAKNLLTFLEILIDKKDKKLAVNWDDEIVKATALTRDGAVVHPNFKPKTARLEGDPHDRTVADAVDPFVFRLSIFVLAVFVGYYVVWSVTPALHTPLMSVTNAISSVIVVGALLAVGVALVANDSGPIWARALGFVALVFASVNIFGGFLVTQRMLAMYQKKKK